MPIYKNSENSSNDNLNLDSYHEKILSDIEKNEQQLPEYTRQIELLKNAFEKECSIDKKMEMKDQIHEYRNRIKKIKRAKKDYLLANSQYIFEYFEQKKNISKQVELDETKKRNNDNNNDNNDNNDNNNNDNNNININDNGNNKIDLDFFFYSRIRETNNTNNNNNNNNASSSMNHLTPKNTNIDKYFQNVINNINMTSYYFDSNCCNICYNGELIFIENEGVIICNQCYNTHKFYIENDKPNYREPPKEVCFYAYKRINHLREILAQFQAKETTLIPDHVIENLKNQIKKERISIKELSNKKTKEILKNLGYNKYYEHIPFIKEKLGIKPPVMTQELEEKLCNLFTEIQPIYAKYCPKDRVNFLNYYYTIYKLCELLDEHQFLPYFPMLKDREKRMEQDAIWKNICRDLNWEFVPTI